jgi:peptide/nickel transport system permease protein
VATESIPGGTPVTAEAQPTWVLARRAGARLRRAAHAPVSVWLAGIWATLIVFAAITANWLPIPGYNVIVGPPALAPGFRTNLPLGTDGLGRSELSRLIFGARASLAVAIASVAIGMLLGAVLGMLAGYNQGWLDGGVSLVTDSILSIPALVLLIGLTSIRVGKGSSYGVLVAGLVVVSIPTFARLARGQTIIQARREYVMAARALGMTRRRLIFLEILPNVAMPILSYALVIVGVLIVVEGSLSFLGLGIPPPTPSWGGMIADSTQSLNVSPALVVTPAVVVALTVLAFNVLGDHARARYEESTGK